MFGPEDTSKRPSELHLLGMLSDGQSGYIEDMEAAGQQQLVHSNVIPTNGPSDEELTALGFQLGEQVQGDMLFRNATLPAGWKKEGSDHAMWSYILDERGRRRVAVFYKAAFYDRDAFMRLETPHSYLSAMLYENGSPVFDDKWLTPAIAIDQLTKIESGELAEAAECDEYAKTNPYWVDRAKDHRTKAAQAAKMRAAVQS
jgi:hypothetical protein